MEFRNQAFIVNYDIKYRDEFDDDEDAYSDDEDNDTAAFRIFISTKRLLKMASSAEKLHTDATYKLIWQGFPVLIIGTTDYDRHFHVIGMAICSNEQTRDFQFLFESINKGLSVIKEKLCQPAVLIADGSDAIRLAFTNVFGDKLMVMCWAHMYRNVTKRIQSLVQKDNQNDILDDIEVLQIAKSDDFFENASTLFVKKWKTKEPEFTAYFESEWLNSHQYWYEGIRHFTPSTNNALESFNKIIKDESTFRERLVLARFKVLSCEMVENWSKEYERKNREYIATPTITLDTWTKAYAWAKSNKNIVLNEIPNSNINYYYVPSGDEIKITDTEINTIENMRWNTFDQYKKRSSAAWLIQLPKDGTMWKNGTCNCPAFFKKFICKHTVGISIRLKYCKPPPAAKDIPIGEKRKRGRPKKATKALLID